MTRSPVSRSLATRLATASAAALLFAAGAGPALAQSSTTTAPATTTGASGAQQNRLAREDTAFLKQAAQNGHAEVESSKLAVTKASSDKVKSFAQQMIDDHTKANSELTALAASKGVEVPDGPSVAQKGKLKVLGMSDGAKFDAKYADQMGVKAHEDTVKLFEKAAANAKDPEIKAWAAKTLPTLQQHLEHARTLKSSVAAK